MARLKCIVKSERGASFLLAMLFFLVCGTVAAVVVLSASTNVERVKQQQAEEQAYLTLSSSAQTVKDVFAGKAIKFVGSTSGGQLVSSGLYRADDEGLNPVVEDAFTNYIKAACTQALLGAGAAYTSTFEIDVDAEGMDSVTGTLTITDANTHTLAQGTAYNLKITLASSSEDYRYTMTMNFKSSANGPSEATDPMTGKIVRTTIVTWPAADITIEKGAVSKDKIT